MRLLCCLLFIFILNPLYADDPDPDPDSGFPSPAPSSMPNPSSPYNSSPTNANPGSQSGSDTFGTMVQQQTSQALQTFQNVNYQKLSGNESQDDFSSDDASDASPDPNHLFNIFSGS